MCKAKARLQQAHGYIPGTGSHWPAPGTIVQVYDHSRETIRGAVQAVNSIGLRIKQDRGALFIPWPAVRRITWDDTEETIDGLDDVQDPPHSAGPVPPD